MDQDKFDFIFKIVIIGESGVGKTQLLHYFIHEKFKPEAQPTIGVEFQIKTINIDGKSIKIHIWDTAGQERFQSITKNYYRGAVGALLLYDITSSSSFSSLQKWINELKTQGEEGMIVMLIGNKNDMETKRTVLKEEGENLATENEFLFFETSAKNGENVEQSFHHLVRQLIFKTAKPIDSQSPQIENQIKPSVAINQEKIPKKSCCK